MKSLRIAFLILLLPTAAYAQSGQKKKPPPPPPPPPKVVVRKIQLFELTAITNQDGKDLPAEKLGKKHRYGATDLYGAPGKLVWKQRFKGRQRLEFSLIAHRAIKDLKFKLTHGAMLEPTGVTGRALAPKAPLDQFDFETIFETLEKTIEDSSDEDVVAAARKVRALEWNSTMTKATARGRLLRWRKLLALRKAENALVAAELLAEKKRPLANMSFDDASSDALIRLAEAFETRALRELWWQIELEYFFSFGSLGRDVTDGPGAAFVAGGLDRGVSSIAIDTKVSSAKRRVLWYRFPGYNNKDQSLDLQLPKGWMGRVFAPGKETGGALVFVLVPGSKKGAFEILWKANANTGARLRIERPEPGFAPF